MLTSLKYLLVHSPRLNTGPLKEALRSAVLKVRGLQETDLGKAFRHIDEGEAVDFVFLDSSFGTELLQTLLSELQKVEGEVIPKVVVLM